MVTRIAHPVPPPAAGHRRRSRYELGWSAVAGVTAAVLMALAIVESPPLPLLGLVLGLGTFGGLVAVRAPVTSSRGRRQFADGALGVASLVLVAVGIGHQLSLGLAAVGLLGVSSPWTLRWITNL